ncbi:beta-1,3-galactosyltransferase 5-like [Anoplophora glabripennis]|uniref:beta-1,3-galactosyltransferase 5-like n=1 Tax=Anoplophora glabripennis TaxID=217634 RepID=UPI000873D2E4|nr:beta-1,3-galactosyltransferase 5-like [Anoplophora glabripennis]
MPEKRLWSKVVFIWAGISSCVVFWKIAQCHRASPGVFPVNDVYTSNTQNCSRFSYPIDQLPATDYNRLINIDFIFSILNLVCNESKPLLVILVHSSPENFAKRKTIRETWGKNEEDVKILFMLGSVNSSDLQKTLEDENRSHNDFIQGNFLDTYRNITYKHVMVFKYVIYHCPQAKYILKTDDDVFVNIPTMKRFLTVDLSPYGANKVLFCVPVMNARVKRSYRSKWRIPFSEYPSGNYPTYCSGWTILYSPDVIFALYKGAQNADYFWIDDVYITGRLIEKVQLTHVDIERLVIPPKELGYIVKDYSYNVSKPFLFGGADLKEKEIRALWKFVSTHPAPRSIFKKL